MSPCLISKVGNSSLFIYCSPTIPARMSSTRMRRTMFLYLMAPSTIFEVRPLCSIPLSLIRWNSLNPHSGTDLGHSLSDDPVTFLQALRHHDTVAGKASRGNIFLRDGL